MFRDLLLFWALNFIAHFGALLCVLSVDAGLPILMIGLCALLVREKAWQHHAI